MSNAPKAYSETRRLEDGPRSQLYTPGVRRSAVRSGLFDARDRATKRRRDRRREDETPDPRPELERWLGQWVRVASANELMRVDLRRYLRESARFDIAPQERLRLLAIECEFVFTGSHPALEWDALDRIYREALRLDDRDPWVHASRGSSAAELATYTEDEEAAVTLSRKAHEYLRVAASLAPKEAHIAYATGYATYMVGAPTPQKALAHFDRALELDPEHGWSRLYRAHCLHDLGRWPEAVEAYAIVPKQQFAGPKAWRMDLLVEQLGWCRLQAGDVDGARADLERILCRYEQQPHLAEMSSLRCLRDAAEEAFVEWRERVQLLYERSLGV